MLDIGCSYGVGSIFVKHRRSFDQLIQFFATEDSTDYERTCQVTREWLDNGRPHMRCVGMDCSEPAIRFAEDVGLLDHGISRNLEDPEATLDDDDCRWLRECNLFISTGAIGYVTERSLHRILAHLGKEAPNGMGPLGVVTILRMFDVAPIQAAFEHHGLQFGRVSQVRLPQRRFVSSEERKDVLDVLHGRGISTSRWEDRGSLYADLYVVAPSCDFSHLLDRMIATQEATQPAGARS